MTARRLLEKSQPREKHKRLALKTLKYPKPGTDFAPIKVFIAAGSLDTL